MRFASISDITHINNRIRARNSQRRYNSEEERIFTHFAAAGMLSIWNPVKKTGLNGAQKNIIEGYLSFLFNNLSELPLNTRIDALQAIKQSAVSEETINHFKDKNAWETIDEIRNILNHPCPQNRYQGNYNAFIQEHLKGRIPITPEENEAVETGVYNGVVYYYSSGFGSTVLKEAQGKFGLTGRNKIAPPKSSRFFLLSELPDDKETLDSFKNSIVIINKWYELKTNRSNHKLEFLYINDNGHLKKINIDEIAVLEKELDTLGLLSMLAEKSTKPISLDEKLEEIDNNKFKDKKIADKFKTRIIEHSDLGAPEVTKDDVCLYIYELIETQIKNCLEEQKKYAAQNKNESNVNDLPTGSVNLPLELPRDITLNIGRFFDRNTASNIAQTCKSANNLACEARESYIQENGKSYEIEPYQAYVGLFF